MNDSSERSSLLAWSREQWEHWLREQGESCAHATTLLQQIHQYGHLDSKAMDRALPVRVRRALPESFDTHLPHIEQVASAQDGTRKCVLRLSGGALIEMVLIPHARRATLCVSSQAGCALNCSFCHTARGGLQRNLRADEIIAQLWLARHHLWPQTEVTNVVFMGMGEPLANLDAVLGALRLFQEDHAYGLGTRRVTVSTAGLVPGIDRLAREASVSLAVSLHAPHDALRTRLMPINARYPIDELLAACTRYCQVAPHARTVTIEYALLAEVNDDEACAQALVRKLEGLPVKVNLIPFNPFLDSGYAPSSPATQRRFFEILQQAGIVTTTRRARGEDISAACGQLAGTLPDSHLLMSRPSHSSVLTEQRVA